MSILPPQDLLTLRHSDPVTNIESQMDSLKAAAGLGAADSSSASSAQKAASGEEPLSGEKGRGTVEEPYDQGNAEGEFSLGGFVFLMDLLVGRKAFELADCVC